MPDLNQSIDRSLTISRDVAAVLDRRAREAWAKYAARIREAWADWAESGSPAQGVGPQRVWHDLLAYNVDFAQRSLLFLDALRQRGNNWIAHEAAGKPPVLAYRYQLLATGARSSGPSTTRSCASFRRKASTSTTGTVRTSSSTRARVMVPASAASRRIRKSASR